MTPDNPQNTLPPPDPQAEEHLRQWGAFIKSATAPEVPPGLADRTLAAIAYDRLPVPAPAEQPYRISNWPRRLREYSAIAVAAGILVAVLIPGISQARQSSRRVACAANLSAYATAFGTYAAANSNLLPTFATVPDNNWLGHPAVAGRPGQPSNADNLLPLLTDAYITPDRLACPGRGAPDAPYAAPAGPDTKMHPASIPDGYRGYSYTALAANHRTHWDGSPDTLVLSDRNPLFDPRASDAAPTDNSLNHNGKGNYVLAADGSVAWDTNPNVGIHHDNVWTLGGPQSIKLAYAGVETTTPDDAFLAP